MLHRPEFIELPLSVALTVSTRLKPPIELELKIGRGSEG
jgi:hypothetical protein